MKLSANRLIKFTEGILLLFSFIKALMTLSNIRSILVQKLPYFPELDDAKISWINDFKSFISSWWCIFYCLIMPSFTSYYQAFHFDMEISKLFALGNDPLKVVRLIKFCQGIKLIEYYNKILGNTVSCRSLLAKDYIKKIAELCKIKHIASKLFK